MKKQRSTARLLLFVVCGVLGGCPAADKGSNDARPAESNTEFAHASEPTAFPNIVMIIMDTLRADGLGVYGSEVDSSPKIDWYAERGVVFEKVLAQCTWTRPSMGALLTGRYPRTLGLYTERNQILNDRFVTLSEVLKASGYTTFGLTANPTINSAFGFHQGFDTYVDSNVLLSFMRAKGSEVKLGKRSLLTAPELLTKASALIDTTQTDRPVYLQISFMEAHEWEAFHKRENMLRVEYNGLFDPAPFRRYKQIVRQMTDDIGEFLEALLKRQGWKDTLLVFVSDHGEGLGDHPNVARSKNHGTLMYESHAMVPWIMYQASWTPHVSRVKRDVRLMDVMPTLLDHLGVAGPEDMDGISVKPLIDGFDELPELPRYKVLETYFRTEKISVYADDYAYIFSPVSHIGIDKRELQARGGKENGIRTNAIEDHPKVAEELKAFLVEWKETHKKAQPTASKRGISKDEEAQLQAIGYL